MRRRPGVELAGVGLLATLLAWLVFRPSAAELTATLPAHQGSYADAVLLTWAIGHVSRTLFGVLAPLFDAPVFHPAGHTLAFGDHMIGQAALGLPVWWLTGNPVLEYNVLSFASYPAAVVGGFAYARHGLRLPPPAALAAGIAFAFTPYRLHSPLWLQVLWAAFVPLALLAWLTFVRTGAWRAWAAWVGCWTFHSLLGLYLALYFGIVMAVLGAWALAAAPRRHDRRVRLGTLLAPLAVLLLLAPTLLPYAELRELQGNVRQTGLDTRWTFLLPHASTLSAMLLGLPAAPGWFGPGAAAWLLAAIGMGSAVATLVRRRTPVPPEERFLASVHLLGLAVTLALLLVPAGLQQLVPGLDMLRVTNRVFFVTLAFLGAFVGMGAAWCGARLPAGAARAVVSTAALAAVTLDMGRPPTERKPIVVPARLPPAIAFLAAQPPGAGVYEHVFGPDQLALAMYHGLFHHHASPIGWSGFLPPGASFANIALYDFPAPSSVEVMRRLEVGWVWKRFRTVEDGAAFATELPPGVRVAARFGTDLVFDVRDVTALPAPAVGAEPVSRALWDGAPAAGASDLDMLRDGDPTTLWEYTRMDPFTPAAYAIDLGRTHRVAAVGVRTPRGLGDAIAVARVEVSGDGQQWAPFATFLPEPFEPFFVRPPRILTLVARSMPVEARFVRFVATRAALWAGPWRIGELEVLAAPGYTSASGGQPG